MSGLQVQTPFSHYNVSVVVRVTLSGLDSFELHPLINIDHMHAFSVADRHIYLTYEQGSSLSRLQVQTQFSH